MYDAVFSCQYHQLNANTKNSKQYYCVFHKLPAVLKLTLA